MVTPYPEEKMPMIRALRGEVVSNLELFMVNQKKPQGVWLSVNGTPMRDGRGAIEGAPRGHGGAPVRALSWSTTTLPLQALLEGWLLPRPRSFHQGFGDSPDTGTERFAHDACDLFSTQIRLGAHAILNSDGSIDLILACEMNR